MPAHALIQRTLTSESETKVQYIDKIIEVTNAMRVSDKVVKIFTFTDPSRIGVAQFKSVAGRNGFLKRMHTAGHKWNEQDKMWCKSNTTLEQRIVDKTLG